MSIENNYKYEIYRKLIHLSSLWMVGVIWFLNQKTALLIFACLAILIFLSEISRKYLTFSNKIYHSLFSKIIRIHESKGHLSGAFFVLFSALISVAFFPKTIAATSLAVMLISDSVAALVGRKFGHHKLFDKSIEGSLVFFMSAIFVISFFYNFQINFFAIIFTAFLATIIELFSKKLRLDDNLTITLIVGLSLSILS
jgi:dolichol kinase